MHSDGEEQCFEALLAPIPTANLSVSEPLVGGLSAFCLYPDNYAQHRLQLAFRLPKEKIRQTHIGFRILGDNLVCTPLAGLNVYSVAMDPGGGWNLQMCKVADFVTVMEEGCQYRCQCTSACLRILASINSVKQKPGWRMCSFTLFNPWLILRTHMHMNVYLQKQSRVHIDGIATMDILVTARKYFI